MDSRKGSGLANTVIGIAGAGLALVLYGAIRFPASIASTPTPFIMSVVGLLGYALAGVFARRATPRMQPAFRTGGVLGLCVAAAGVINHTLEVMVSLPSAVGAVLGLTSACSRRRRVEGLRKREAIVHAFAAEAQAFDIFLLRIYETKD